MTLLTARWAWPAAVCCAGKTAAYNIELRLQVSGSKQGWQLFSLLEPGQCMHAATTCLSTPRGHHATHRRRCTGLLSRLACRTETLTAVGAAKAVMAAATSDSMSDACDEQEPCQSHVPALGHGVHHWAV